MFLDCPPQPLPPSSPSPPFSDPLCYTWFPRRIQVALPRGEILILNMVLDQLHWSRLYHTDKSGHHIHTYLCHCSPKSQWHISIQLVMVPNTPIEEIILTRWPFWKPFGNSFSNGIRCAAVIFQFFAEPLVWPLFFLPPLWSGAMLPVVILKFFRYLQQNRRENRSTLLQISLLTHHYTAIEDSQQSFEKGYQKSEGGRLFNIGDCHCQHFLETRQKFCNDVTIIKGMSLSQERIVFLFWSNFFLWAFIFLFVETFVFKCKVH